MKFRKFVEIGGSVKVTATGSAHDMAGKLQKNSAETIEVLKHLQEKITSHADEIIRVRADLTPNADALVLSYGISARSAAEAVLNLRKQGHKVSFLNVKTLFPIPAKDIIESARGVMRIVIVEENMMGLYRSQIEHLFHGTEVVGVNGIGRMITPKGVENAVAPREQRIDR